MSESPVLGHVYSSPLLFQVAQTACGLACSGDEEVLEWQRPTLTSLLFSAAALEAFINEFIHLAAMTAGNFADCKPLQMLAAIHDESDSPGSNVQLKYRLAKVALSDSRYDTGAAPYQDFALLFRIRNALVHLRPEALQSEPHYIVKALSSRKLCVSPPSGDSSGWLQHIQTPKVANWACDSALRMVESITEPVHGQQELHAHEFASLWILCKVASGKVQQVIQKFDATQSDT